MRREPPPEEDRDGEDTDPLERSGPGAWLGWILRWFRGPSAVLLEPEPEPPAVVVACNQCGFDYDVRKIDFGGGRIGAFWTCTCGSQYIPPGGKESFSLVRP